MTEGARSTGGNAIAASAALATGLSADVALHLLAELGDAVIVLDRDLRLVWGNRVAETFFGYTVDDVRGQDVLELFPDTRGGPIEGIYRRVARGGAAERLTLLYPRTDRWLSLRVLPWLRGIIAFYRDVDGEQRAQEALRASEARYRAMAEHVSDVLSVSDAQGICTWISPSAEALLGYAPDELLGRALRELVVGDDLPSDASAQGRLEAGAKLQYRFRVRRKDGSLRWVEATGQIVEDRNGERESIFVSRDVTQAVEVESRLRQAQESAERLAAARATFVANISHEIRTPLHGILGVAGLLADTPLDEEQQRLIEVIRGSGASLLGIVNDVLDLSKMEAGHLRLALEPTPIAPLIEGTVELFAVQAATKHLELIAAVDPALPRRALLDEARVRQVLSNLVGNAIKFTERGEVFVSATRVAAVGGDELRLVVRDTGIGVDAALRERVFEPFVQVDATTTRRRGGTGLGLSISRHLVRLMGGSIGVEGEVGQGSSFVVRLPLREAQGVGPPPATPNRLQGVRVAVVSDNATLRTVVSAQLSRRGAHVETFGDAVGCRVAAATAAFDLAIRDLSPDGCDEGCQLGFEVAPRTLNLAPPASGQGPRPLPPLLIKPVREQLLAATVERLLSSETDTPLPRRSSNAEPTAGLAGLRVLLAEDNDINALVVELQLRRLGVSCKRVGDGAAAVAACREDIYDLVLMDVQMPLLDGLDATRQIRACQVGRQPVIAALTAGALDNDRQRALAAGMDAHLSKPMPEQALVKLLQQVARAARGG